jgi:fimbrial isopeptide formation D2 family protein
VAIGEEVAYSIVIPIPENGALNDVVVTDSLPSGLVFVGIDSIVMAPSITGPATLTPSFSGNDVLFTLGTVTNTDIDNFTTESYSITYTAYVDNTAYTNDNDSLQNTVELRRSDGVAHAVAPQLRIVEPTLTFDKSVPTTNDMSARTVTYTVAIAHVT